MKKIGFTHIILFAVWVLSLAVSVQVNAQTPAASLAQNPQKVPPKLRFVSGNSSLKIPLEIDNNLILMRVSVNDSKPLRFIFDTGASVSFINQPRAAELGLKANGQVRGTATGGNIQVSLISGVKLSVPGAEVSNQLMASMDLPMPPGFEFDGIIGYDFIDQFVVEIDYPNRIMNLYDPRHFNYSGKGEFIPFSLGHRTPLARAKFILEGRPDPIEANLEVDTGADGTFVLKNAFVEKQKLWAAVSNPTQYKGRGAGGEQKRLLARVKAVQFGPFLVNNPPVALSLDSEGEGASEENAGVIGGEVFRRFKLILDYSRKQMILEPNASFSEPYADPSGL